MGDIDNDDRWLYQCHIQKEFKALWKRETAGDKVTRDDVVAKERRFNQFIDELKADDRISPRLAAVITLDKSHVFTV